MIKIASENTHTGHEHTTAPQSQIITGQAALHRGRACRLAVIPTTEFGKLDQALFTLLLVLLAVVSMEALRIRQREGVYHQRRGAGWHHVSPGMMEVLVLPLLIDSRMCVPSVTQELEFAVETDCHKLSTNYLFRHLPAG